MRTGPSPQCPCGDRQAGDGWDLGPPPTWAACAGAGPRGLGRLRETPRAFPGFTRFSQAEASCGGGRGRAPQSSQVLACYWGTPPTQATNWGPPLSFMIYFGSGGGSHGHRPSSLQCPWPGSPGQGLRPWEDTDRLRLPEGRGCPGLSLVERTDIRGSLRLVCGGRPAGCRWGRPGPVSFCSGELPPPLPAP